MASVAGCSVRHLLREFQQTKGHIPMRYVQMQRMERAKDMLVQQENRSPASPLNVASDMSSTFPRLSKKQLE
ncbi:helix-turn-helix domain-containing protein [Rhizobium lusitanum]|uniref:Helix-turn-helix domain-containing protein n=1 Tax=Rhizobium lusitanum TaxID=293958 RepID=A0A6L9UCR9_9HYPH|nr:helix-turn-helix domain-containing protein [Rhizobium lusitanum]